MSGYIIYISMFLDEHFVVVSYIPCVLFLPLLPLVDRYPFVFSFCSHSGFNTDVLNLLGSVYCVLFDSHYSCIRVGLVGHVRALKKLRIFGKPISRPTRYQTTHYHS